jgi:hypothetical protein
MKRIGGALVLILATLVLPFAGLFSVEAADSPVAFPLLYKINIMSPSNSTYNSSALALDVNVTTLGGSNIYTTISYTLDGASNQTIPLTIEYPAGNTFMMAQHLGSVDLSPLTNGSHKVIVYVKCEYPNDDLSVDAPDTITTIYNSTVYFTINTNTKQQIPEFPTWTILPLLGLATVVVMLYRKKLQKTHQQSYL